MIKEVKTYECTICGTSYDTKGEAEKCYTNCTTCECLKSDKYLILAVYYNTDRYGDDIYQEIRIDFSNKMFYRQVSGENTHGKVIKLRNITHCPFCGRKL